MRSLFCLKLLSFPLWNISSVYKFPRLSKSLHITKFWIVPNKPSHRFFLHVVYYIINQKIQHWELARDHHHSNTGFSEFIISDSYVFISTNVSWGWAQLVSISSSFLIEGTFWPTEYSWPPNHDCMVSLQCFPYFYHPSLWAWSLHSALEVFYPYVVGITSLYIIFIFSWSTLIWTIWTIKSFVNC